MGFLFERSLAVALVLLVSACSSVAPTGSPVGSDAVENGIPAPELKNTLRWKTASEVDNFGFDVYRGPSEEGPFERLTATPIAGAGTSDEPQNYSFEDVTIEPGATYWYYVESIDMSGVRERFTPVFAAKPKGAVPPPD